MTQVRAAGPADLAGLRGLLAGFLGRSAAELAQHGESLAAVLADAGSLVFVVGTPPVAFVTASLRRVSRYPYPIAEIDELYVPPEYRRRGVGRALVSAVAEAAARAGAGRLFVASNAARPEAHRFYEGVGFVNYGVHFRAEVAALAPPPRAG